MFSDQKIAFSRRNHLGRKWWQTLSTSFRSGFRSARLRRPRLECLASGARLGQLASNCSPRAPFENRSTQKQTNTHHPPHNTSQKKRQIQRGCYLRYLKGMGVVLGCHMGGIVLIRFSVRGYRFKIKCCCRPCPIQSLCPELMEPAI